MLTPPLNSRRAAKFASCVLAFALAFAPALALAAPERSTSVIDTKSVKSLKDKKAPPARSKAKHAPPRKPGRPAATTTAKKRPCDRARARAHAPAPARPHVSTRTAALPRNTAHR